MSFKRKCDFDNDYLAKDEPHDSNNFNGHKNIQSTALNTRGSRPSSLGSARSRISRGSSTDNKYTHPRSSSLSKKSNKKFTPLDQKVLLKETYEFWIYEDLLFRNSLPNPFIAEGSGFPSESSGAASLMSAGSETSISCYTNSSDYLSFNGPRLYPTFSDEEYNLISTGKYKPLFEKLVFSIHSKNRVEAIKNFLSKIRISRRQEYLSAKHGETSPFLSLRDRIQDLKIKVKYHTSLQREQQVSLQKLKSSISQLIERKSSLTSVINQTKTRIALKGQFAENLIQSYFPKLDDYFFNRIKKSRDQFLEQSAKKAVPNGISLSSEPILPTLDSFQMIREYLSNIKLNKLAELDEPLSGDNVFLRHEARMLASRLRFSEILEEITTETAAGAIRLATYPNLTLSGPWKDNAQVNGSSIYQEKLNQYFSFEMSDYLPEKHLVQGLRKSLLPRQLELKEKISQLQMIKNTLHEKIEALSISASPETKEQRHQLYCQSILLALETTQLPGLETTYHSPPLLKLKLNCELKPHLVLRQIACDVAQVSQQLQHAQTTVISLCRSLEITPQKLKQPQPLGPLGSSFISLCKDGAKWILSELKQASRIDLNALLGIVMCPPAIPLHTAAQFPAPWTHAQVIPSSLLAIHRPTTLEVSGPLAWHKTPDWVFPLILELRTQGHLTQQLYDSLRRQVFSHEGAWETSLRSWGSESLITLDASGLCDFAPSLDNIVSQAKASWALKPQLHLATLHQAINTDIPQTHTLHQEIKDILCERDKLLNTFDF